MKYYGIRKGIKIGVYTTWNKVKPLVTGFTGAEFQAFATIAEAYRYVKGTEPKSEPEPEHKPEIVQKTSGKSNMDLFKKQTVTLFSKTTSKSGFAGSTRSTRSAEKGGSSKFSGSNDCSNVDLEIKKYHSKLPTDTNILYVYTDGSTVGNGKRGAKGGWGAFFSDPRIPPIYKSLIGSSKQKVTNNVCEIIAVIEAIKVMQSPIYSNIVSEYKSIMIFSDNRWTIDSVTKWYSSRIKNNWMRQDWKKGLVPVENKELI